MKFSKKLTTAIATSAVLLNALAPLALADTSLTISGNGDNANSTVSVNNNTNTTVEQHNVAHVTNNVTTNANTGDNNANHNTGGDVNVTTGSVNSTATVTNELNANQATVSNNNSTGNTTATISGNGDGSNNGAHLNTTDQTYVGQDNFADVHNTVSTNANTGHNGAYGNTGGDVTMTTGSVTSNDTVSTAANANIAQVGGSENASSSINLTESGNGDDSHNSIRLNNDPTTTISQDNDAHIDNNVTSHLGTGGNFADHNTGASVNVKTGDANATVGVDNATNFNAADVLDNGLATTVNATIGGSDPKSGNGDDSDNRIAANLGGFLYVDQGYGDNGNNADLNNNVASSLYTGHNAADHNTGGHDSQFTDQTGNSMSNVSVNNAGNANVYGDLSNLHLPGNTNVSISFDLSQLLGMLHVSI